MFARQSLWLTSAADVFCTNCSNLSVSLLCIQSAPAHAVPWCLNKKNGFHDALFHQNGGVKPALLCISELSDKLYKLLNLKKRHFIALLQHSN